MNNNTNNTMTNDASSLTFVPASLWIEPADAKALRKQLVDSGLDKKQVKISSYRWKDIKDHSKGYLARVMIVKGLRPDLEVETKRSKKSEIATTCESSNSNDQATTMTYYVGRESVSEDTFTN